MNLNESVILSGDFNDLCNNYFYKSDLENIFCVIKVLQMYLITIQLLFFVLKGNFGYLLTASFKNMHDKFIVLLFLVLMTVVSNGVTFYFILREEDKRFSNILSAIVFSVRLFVVESFHNDISNYHILLKIFCFVVITWNMVIKILIFLTFSDFIRNELMYKSTKLYDK